MCSGKAILNLEFYIPSQTITPMSCYSAAQLTQQEPYRFCFSCVLSHESTGRMAIWNSPKVMKSRYTYLIFWLYLEESQELNKKEKKKTRDSHLRRRGYVVSSVRGKGRLMAETGSVELEVEASWWVLGSEEPCLLQHWEARVGRTGDLVLWDQLEGKFGVQLRKGCKLKRQRNCFRVKEMHSH